MNKRIIFIILLLLLTFFILNNLNDGKNFVEVLSKAKWGFILIALFIQAAHFSLVTLSHKKAFQLYNINWNFKEMLSLTFASLAINITAPLAPLPGSSVFLQKARKGKIPALSISASILLVVFFDYIALVPFLFISILFLFFNKEIFLYEIVAISIFSILTLSLFIILIFGYISPKFLNFIFWLIQKVVNRIHFLFKKRNYLIEEWPKKRTMQFIDISKNLINSRGKKRELLFLALTKHLGNLACLYLLFLAFGMSLPLASLFAGYSMMILFWIVTPTPQGVGLVETLTPALFSSMGINIETATLAVLAYRGLNLWIPVIIGLSYLHRIIKN